MDAMVADGVPGVYLQIRRGDRITGLRSGRPDVGTGRDWEQRSRFRVGSVSKTFVAAVVMQLVAEGRLRLSDPVERWMPGRFPYGRQITVRQLLNHPAGVPAYESLDLITEQYDQPDRRLTPQQLLARIDGQPLITRPGTAGPVLDATTMNPTYAWGAGNLVSSGRDLTRFFRALMKGQVVPQPQLAQMRVAPTG